MLNRAKSNFLVTNRGNRLRLRRSFASSCCLPSNFVNIRFQGVRRVTRHFVIFAFIALFFLTQQGDCHLTNERKGYELQRALSFLERMQSNCSSPLYTVVGVGGGGGFASQFQEAASEWIRAAASLNYTGEYQKSTISFIEFMLLPHDVNYITIFHLKSSKLFC